MAAVTLPAEDTSARTARRLVSAALDDWDLNDLVDTAVLLTSELVTNAVVHAGSALELAIERRDGGVRVSVADASRLAAVVQGREPQSTHGRGLQLVEALADRWGSDGDGPGKRVWFDLGTAGGSDRGEGGVAPEASASAPSFEVVAEAFAEFAELAAPTTEGDDPAGIGTAARSRSSLSDLAGRAVLASQRAFSVSDPSLPDNPLVYVNPAFEKITGYAAEDAVGRNCRFLQGSGADPAAVAELRLGVAELRPVVATVLNQRKDGSTFWNEVSISPVTGLDGEVSHFVGVQSDVTARVLALAEAERALAEAETATRAAESAHARLELLAEATTLLTASLDLDATLGGLARLVVPRLGDACAIDLIVEDGTLVRRTGRHVVPTKTAIVRALAPEDVTGAEASMLAGMLERSVLLPEVDEAAIAAAVEDERRLAAYRALDLRSVLAVPLSVRGRALGILTLATTGDSGRTLDEGDLALLEDLSLRAAQAIDNARLYRAEQRVAETLQRSMLPDRLPVVANVTLASRYVAGSDVAEVGGDWYDAIVLPDGALGLVVGDVMGHDLTAAALMGQMRSFVRAYAVETASPAELLARVDGLVQHLDLPAFASVAYCRLEPTTGTLTWTRAGHPPPLVIDATGGTEYLEGGASVLVGVAGGVPYREDTICLAPGSTLLLYTDGLIERRGESLEDGLARLAQAASDAVDLPLESTCDSVLVALGAKVVEDDVALLAVRLPLLT